MGRAMEGIGLGYPVLERVSTGKVYRQLFEIRQKADIKLVGKFHHLILRARCSPIVCLGVRSRSFQRSI